MIEFLSGDVKPIQRELERRMQEAAADERFEDAARYRNRLFAVQHLVERQAVERQSVGTVDVIGFAAEGDRAVVQIFPLRGGKMVDRHSFHLENVGGQDVTTILESFGLEYYGSAPSVPPQIVVPSDAGDLSALAELLSERRGARVEIRTAERGEKRRLQRLADENALHVLTSDLAQGEQRRLRRVEALEQLRETLNLESLPLRIECFDISTAMGQDNVGSMVVFQDGLPKKAHYRKFTIRDQEGMDDFAAMGEMISRRFARLATGVDRGRVRRVVRGDAEPRRGRRRQGPARGGARRDAGVRPAARRRDRAREAGGGGVRARAGRGRSSSHGTTRASSSCSGSATRRTASPSASTGSGASRAASRRCSTSSRASARRGGGRSSTTSARSTRCSRRRRRSSRACRACPPKVARSVYAQLHKAGRA